MLITNPRPGITPKPCAVCADCLACQGRHATMDHDSGLCPACTTDPERVAIRDGARWKATADADAARIHQEHGERKRRQRNAPAVAERHAKRAEIERLIAIASQRSSQANGYTLGAVSSSDHATAADAHDKAAEAHRALGRGHTQTTARHERLAQEHRGTVAAIAPGAPVMIPASAKPWEMPPEPIPVTGAVEGAAYAQHTADTLRALCSVTPEGAKRATVTLPLGFAAVLAALVVADDAAGYTHHKPAGQLRYPAVVIPRELWDAVRVQLAKVIPEYPHAPRFVVVPCIGSVVPGAPHVVDGYRDTVTGYATGADFKCRACKRGRDSIARIDSDGVLCECGKVTP